MKKVLLFISLILLTSCSIVKTKQTDVYARYNNFVDLIKNNVDFEKNFKYLDFSYNNEEINDGNRIDLYLDNPKIAMYNVEVLAIIKDDTNPNRMYPNLGVLEEKKYNMIPNQSNIDLGFIKGIALSIVCENKENTFQIILQYKNQEGDIIHREFVEVEVK